MEKITRRIRDDYKLKATIIENVALSNPICTYTDKGELYTSYENCEIRMAVITPHFCKQLSMLTRNCTRENYTSMINDVKSFCTDIYNAVRAYGYEDEKRNRILCLFIPNEKGIWIKTYYCLEDGCPQKLNPYGIKSRYIRRLSLDKSNKMSHKLWVTTDWLKRI